MIVKFIKPMMIGMIIVIIFIGIGKLSVSINTSHFNYFRYCYQYIRHEIIDILNNETTEFVFVPNNTTQFIIKEKDNTNYKQEIANSLQGTTDSIMKETAGYTFDEMGEFIDGIDRGY